MTDSERRFLFSVDVDWIPGSEPGLETVLELADEHDLPLTAFVTGRFAVDNPGLVAAVHQEGHEVGTHGWTHGLDREENFRTTSYEEQRERLSRATDAVGTVIGEQPRLFRAPDLQVSDTLLRVLIELGYEVDSSVPSRRFDGLIGGQVGFLSYFRAPHEPYRPRHDTFSEPGDAPLVEVPPSAFLLPMVMSTARRIHPAVCRWIARRVYQRSSVLNFYCHPWEFVVPEERPFPPEAPDHTSRNTGPEWKKPVSEFIEAVLSWGCSPASLQEVAETCE